MNSQTHRKTDFPIQQSEEHRIARRQFLKFACGSALALGAGGVCQDRLFARRVATAPKRVACLDQIDVGGYRLFRYPTEDEPCILVRLAVDRFAAYSQNCTHLMCPVTYQHAQRQFYCPCHEGFFSAEDGRVLAGPPRRPLPRYPVETRGGEIWVLPPRDFVS